MTVLLFKKKNISYEKLIHLTFDFLLKKEKNAEKIRKFNLSIITKYFSEYKTYIYEKIDNLE